MDGGAIGFGAESSWIAQKEAQQLEPANVDALSQAFRKSNIENCLFWIFVEKRKMRSEVDCSFGLEQAESSPKKVENFGYFLEDGDACILASTKVGWLVFPDALLGCRFRRGWLLLSCNCLSASTTSLRRIKA